MLKSAIHNNQQLINKRYQFSATLKVYEAYIPSSKDMFLVRITCNNEWTFSLEIESLFLYSIVTASRTVEAAAASQVIKSSSAVKQNPMIDLILET